MSTQPLSIVSSEPLPQQSLSIVDSKPLPQSVPALGGAFPGAMGIYRGLGEGLSAPVKAVVDRFANPPSYDYSPDDLKSQPTAIANHPAVKLATQMYEQIKNGDMEGLARNIGQLAGQAILGTIAPEAARAIPELPGAISELSDNMAPVKAGLTAAAKTYAKQQIYNIPVVGKPLKAAVEAYSEAAQAPRAPQTVPSAAPEPYQPRSVVLSTDNQTPPVATPPVSAPEPIVPSGPDPQVLDDLTSWSTNGKVSSFSNLKDAEAKAKIIALAGQVKPKAEVIAQQQAARSTPPPPVTPAPVAETPTATPIASAPVIDTPAPEKSIAQQLKDLVQPDEDEEKAITPGTYWPTPQQIGMKEPWPTGDAGVTRHYINAYNKGANAADFVLNNKSGASPITDPRVFDLDATKTQDFIDKAWDHGLGQGNPIPGKYTKPLGGDSLRFAKAYLQHFVDEKVTDSNTLADIVK